MKFDKENYGIYAIIIVLLYTVGLFLYQFKFGSPYWAQRIDFLFGPFAMIFLILLIASIVSIFLNYKYNWVVISLPFLYTLLLPLKVPGSEIAYRGILINIFPALFRGEFFGVLKLLFSSTVPLLSVIYLFIKNIKKIKSKKYEITFTILILTFFILKFVL